MRLSLPTCLLCLLLSASCLYAQSLSDVVKNYDAGHAAHQQGRYQEALAAYERSLTLAKRIKFPQHIAANLSSIGFLYGMLGHYDKALAHLNEALTIVRGINHTHDIASSLHSLGAVYFFSSQYEKALQHFEDALKVEQGLTNPREVAAALNSLGVAHGALGDYDKALEHFERVLQMARQRNSPEDIATALNNMATVYVFQQRYQDAERSALAADDLQKTTKLPWRAKSVLIDIALATQRYDKALALLQAGIPVAQESDHYRFLFYTQQGLALRGLRRLPEATEALLQAVTLAEAMRQRVSDRMTFFGDSAQGGRIRAYRALVATLAERALQGETTDARLAPYGRTTAAAALYFAEATKARVLLESLATAAKRTTREALPPDLRTTEEQLHAELGALEDQWSAAYQRGPAALQAWQERQQRLTQQRQALVTRLRQEHPRYAALHYPQPLPPEALPLQEQEVLLEYAIADDATYLFRASKRGVDKIWRLPVRRADLERQVQAFLKPLQQGGGVGVGAFAPQQGQALYRLLLAEALQDLAPGTPVTIIPDGILGSLPLESLVITPATSLPETRFVGDTWQLTYAQSATVLAFLRTMGPSTASKAFFALGHPIYDGEDPRYAAHKQGAPLPTLPVQTLNNYAFRGRAIQRGNRATRSEDQNATLNYPPLPETESEVKSIAQLLSTIPQPPHVLLHAIANETQLRQVPLAQYRYLHFATHGDLPGKLEGINEPFLLLGQVENTAPDDGFLTLSKVLDLRLDAEMVVLSACVTGRGETIEGEGVANFARALHQAGARNVVVSLWEVASEATEEFMGSFYRALQTGQPKAQALAQARKDIRTRYPNPFFWSAFVLHGAG